MSTRYNNLAGEFWVYLHDVRNQFPRVCRLCCVEIVHQLMKPKASRYDRRLLSRIRKAAIHREGSFAVDGRGKPISLLGYH